MKKLLVILLSLGATLGATAQHRIGGGFRGGVGVHSYGGARYSSPRVTVIAPYAPIYPAYGYGLGLGLGYGFGYSPFYNMYNGPRYQSRPSQLDLQIEEIKNDYDYKISSAKHDNTMAKDERKQKVRDLKHERDQEIIDAKKSYYSSRNDTRNRNNNGSNNNGISDDGNSNNANGDTK